MVETIIEYVSKFLAIMLVLPIHEFAHGFAAVKNGDITPKLYGRYTLNPFAHFDIAGIVCFMLAGFGWAKPVPINSNNFRKYKLGCFTVSIAGVVANYLLAFVAYPLFILASLYLPTFGYFTDVIIYALLFAFSMSLSFAVFNLIPVYPLDGFRVLAVFNKKQGPIFRFLKEKGIYVLYFLVALSILSDVTGIWQLDLFGIGLRFVVNKISIPITLFWGLFF